MSFSVFKTQVKYCYLNKEDQELNQLRSKRQPNICEDTKKLEVIAKENINLFEMKTKLNKLDNKTIQRFESSKANGK